MKHFTTIAVVLGALLVVGAGAYYTHSIYGARGAAAVVLASNISSSTAPSVVYTNPAYHFSLVVPDTLQVQEYQEGGGAITVTFVDQNTNQGFQIYILPHAGSTITGQRFAMDEPSGDMLQPTTTLIDGVKATTFFSTNAVMGDTREVWFIKNDYLYEVVTYKALDSWLMGIMQTWRFI